MGKKTSTNTTKGAAPAKRAAKPTTKTKPAEPAIITPPPKAVAVKTTAPAAPAAKKAAVATTRVPKPAAPSSPTYTQDDVALRAYFIAEKRQVASLPGDSHQDWVEAERQLLAESVTAKTPKAKAKKA